MCGFNMTAIYQQNLVNKNFPYNVIMTNIRDYPPHWHEEFEIIYNVDEAFDLGIGDEVVTLNKGDIYIIEPRVVHSFVLQDKPKYRFILQFTPLALNHISALENMRLKKTHLRPADKVYPRIKKVLDDIMVEEKNKASAYEYMTLSNLYQVMAIIIRDLDKVQCSDKELNNRMKRISRLQIAFDYIDGNFHKKISLQSIADVTGYSTYYFTRFFKEMTGMTFNDYLSHYRILVACKQLLETDYSITDIALNAGFSSIKTFNRVFKEIKGQNPSSYRKNI